VAGNGGQMAGKKETRQERKGKQALVQADVVTEVKATAGTGERGLASLHEAADQLLAEKCRQIVQSLVDGTCIGNMQCAKMLFMLAEPQDGQGAQEKDRRFRSLAMMWAAEPEWTEEQAGAEPED